MRFVILPLSVTSSWGNGHATNYRALGRALADRGHSVTYLERDVPWYRQNRDLTRAPFAELHLYNSLDQLRKEHLDRIRTADVVLIGSFVPEGVEVIRWIGRVASGAKVFYDIDTPVTLQKLAAGDHEYVSPDTITVFDLYLSFTGGPTLDLLDGYGVRAPRVFYCIVDDRTHSPREVEIRWDLGYLGTHSEDRPLDRLLLEPARRRQDLRFCVAGPNHPDGAWPGNVERIQHVPPDEHPFFYCAQRLTLNVTRSQMIAAGYSPSVRLFEAAACGAAIISDRWPGIEEVFEPGEEILVAESTDEVLGHLEMPERDMRRIGLAARSRVERSHSAARRAEQLEGYLRETAGAIDA